MNVIVFLSSYVSRRKGEVIQTALTHLGEWTPLSDSTFAVSTDVSPEQLAVLLKRRVGVEDGLHVVKIPRSHEGRAPAGAREWLAEEMDTASADRAALPAGANRYESIP